MTARDRAVLGVVVVLALVGGFWLLVLGPKRKDASELAGKITAAEQRRDQAVADAVRAEQARKAYTRNYATVTRLGKAVPPDDDVPSLVVQLESAARGTSVDFRAVKLRTGGVASPAAQAGGPGAGAGAPANQQSAAVLPPGAVVGPAGFPTMPFAFTFEGNFFRLGEFFRNVESFTVVDGDRLRVSGRLLTIDGIQLTASRLGFPKIKAQIVATAYLVPEREGLTAGSTAAAPAGSSATTTGTAGATSPVPPATVKGLPR